MSQLLAQCYHAASPRSKADVSLTPARLEAQLRVLLARGLRMTVSPGLRRLRKTRGWSPLASGWRSLAESP